MNFNIIFNKKYDTTINILISIFVGLLITILIIIAYSMSDLDEIESDIKIVDLTSSTTKYNSDSDKSVFRREFDYFLNLFNKKKDISLKDRNVLQDKQTMSVEHQVNCEDKHIKLQEGSINQGIERSVILKKIDDLNYEYANREIDTLNNRISLLEIQLIKYKIDRLDRINKIDSIIKDIDKELGIQIRNRK